MTSSGQPIILNVKSIVGTSYTTPTTLAPNRNYRWWVRAITANNALGPWSQPLDFRVVSSDLPIPSDSASPIDAVQLASVVLTAYADNGIDDGLRSISAHPAGTIVQLTPEAAADLFTESEAEVEALPPITEIDAVMEELALDSFFMGGNDLEIGVPSIGIVPALNVSSHDAAESNKQEARDVILAGVLAAMVVPGSVSNTDRKRRLSR